MLGGMGHIDLHLVVLMSHFVGWLYWLPGCLVAWLPGCLVAWLPGCLVILRMHMREGIPSASFVKRCPFAKKPFPKPQTLNPPKPLLLRRLTIPSPDAKPLRLVSLSKGKTTEYVATFSDTAGLCFYTVPDGGLVSQVGTLTTEHGGNLNPFDGEDLFVYVYQSHRRGRNTRSESARGAVVGQCLGFRVQM
jgi:hypothetical protein